MAYFGYPPSSGPSISSLPPHASAFNHNQLLGSPNSSSGGGGMSGSTSPTGIAISPATTCCEGGRPVATDPVTGQSVCSCQYDASRLTLSSYPRLNPYGPSPYAPQTDHNPPYPSLDSSAFYSPVSLGGAYAATGDVNHGTLSNGYYPNPYDFGAYGYGGGYDLASRRKNATRESTATLKAWLSEHKKNPYPTKGEKIMLAIITKMTLTQVSTWFANARRRLKKENKMTWEPKNKTDDDDDDMKDDDDDGDSSNAPSSPQGSNNNNIGMKQDSSKSDCAAKPKIWRVADTAAAVTPPPSSHLLGHSQHHPHMSHHGPPPAVSSSWSFALPPAYRMGYGGFLPSTTTEGVLSETPPQTPPQIPLLPGSLSHFVPGAGNPSGLHGSSDLGVTAFKPVLKSSSGGFCM